MVSSISYNGAASLSYTYDPCGRIKTVSNGTSTVEYKYDGMGQLLQTNDPTDTRAGANGSVWVNTYDAGGNITTKKLYTYDGNNNNLLDNTLIHTYSYTYDAAWKDKLASFDGSTVNSDAIGNTTGYNGWTYIWEAGRQLKQMSNGSTTLQFKYNDSGLRTQKINGATTTQYYWAGSGISHMTSGSDTLHFWYDAAGQPAMVTYNGTNYYYKLNLQGDIIGLLNTSGTSVVAYAYDSWGKQISCTGTLANTLGAANPLRYRGYIYDSETGLYYLQSRYYNPDWGRFINADGYVSTGQGINATNMFAYCSSNPVNMIDDSGFRPKWIEDSKDWIKKTFNIETTSNSISRSNSIGPLTSSNITSFGYTETMGRIQGTRDAYPNLNDIVGIGAYSKLSIINNSSKISLGNKNVNIFKKEIADIGVLNTIIGLRYNPDDGFTVGTSAKISALSARGTIGTSIFGWEIEVGMTADVGALNYNIMANISKSRGFELSGGTAIGFGFGYIIRIKPPQ